jgi:DNA-binding MarR family transcriptional regulator
MSSRNGGGDLKAPDDERIAISTTEHGNQGIHRAGRIYGLVRAVHTIENRLNELLISEALSLRAVGALAHIAENPATSRAELARAGRTTPQAAGRFIQRLANGGLITLTRGEPGEALRLQLTRDGALSLQRATVIIERVEELLGLDPQSLAELENAADEAMTSISRRFR